MRLHRGPVQPRRARHDGGAAGGRAARAADAGEPGGTLPIVHVLVPADFRDVEAPRRGFSYTWANMAGGLDGIAIDLPALRSKPTHGGLFPLNIQVKDPIWPLRNMLDVSFSVKPGEPHTLWLDTRDRILPNGKALYLTIAGSGRGLSAPASLEGAEIRLVFKPRAEAAAEHVADRFTQVRDNYAQHRRGARQHAAAGPVQPVRGRPHRPAARRSRTTRRAASTGTTANKRAAANRRSHSRRRPRACRCGRSVRSRRLRYLKRFVNWYIDHRQIENGEFGGGLSDDGDLTNWWPGTALMGATPDKITRVAAARDGRVLRQGHVHQRAAPRSRPTSCTATRKASRCWGSPCCSTTAARSSSSARWRPRGASSGSPASTRPAIGTSARLTSAAPRWPRRAVGLVRSRRRTWCSIRR